MRNYIILILLVLVGCNTIKKNQSTKIEQKSIAVRSSVDSSRLEESSKAASGTETYKATDYKSYLNLTPTNPDKPATYTIYENGKEVFRQEVENGSLQSSTHKKDSIFITDTVYLERIKFVYKYKFDTIYIENQSNFAAEESREPATLFLFLKIIPWWCYALFIISILMLIFWKSIKTYLKTLPIVGKMF